MQGLYAPRGKRERQRRRRRPRTVAEIVGERVGALRRRQRVLGRRGEGAEAAESAEWQGGHPSEGDRRRPTF